MTQDDKAAARLDEAALDQAAGGVASPGGDQLTGNSAPNILSGLAGNDTILAGGGNDYLAGGADSDLVAGQDGNDLINGDAGNDTLLGNTGNDTIAGGDGSDVIVGGAGADLIYGDSTNPGTGSSDQFHWNRGDGNDTIYGGGGTDLLVIEDTSLSLQTLLNAIRVDPGSPQPRIENGAIVLTGISGTLTIGGEQITFSQLERLVVGPPANIPYR